MLQHEEKLTALFSCAMKIYGSLKLYKGEEKVGLILDKIAKILPTSETIQLRSENASVKDMGTDAIILAIRKDMTKLTEEWLPMSPAPPKVVDECYVEDRLGEAIALMDFIEYTKSMISVAEMNIEIYEQKKCNAKKKAKIDHDARHDKEDLVMKERKQKMEFEEKFAMATTRLAFVEELKQREDWHDKIDGLCQDYNSDSEDLE